MTPVDRNGDGDTDDGTAAGGDGATEWTDPGDPAVWRDYWEAVFESGRRRQVERAATDPLGAWLVAEVPALADDHDVDVAALCADPDDALAAARDGFEALVATSGLSGPDDDRVGYSALPVHLTTLARAASGDVSLQNAVADANALTTLDGARVVDDPSRRYEAAVLTYRCPRGHETTVSQPLLRTWTVERCPEGDCDMDVVPEDARTRPRTVARFTVDGPGGALPCVATGRYAADEFDRVAAADRLHLTGVVRLLADDADALEPTYEVLAAEPTAP